MVDLGSDMSPGPMRPAHGGPSAERVPDFLAEEQFMSVHQVPYPVTQESSRQPILSLAITREGPAAVVDARGALDMATVDLLVNLVDRVLAGQPPPVLVLDLSGLNFFCAAGVTALLTVRRRAASAGCALVVRKPSRITVAVLDMVGLGDEFATE